VSVQGLRPDSLELEEACMRVAQGEASAFAAIVRGTEAQLYRMAARMLADDGEAEDVVQAAYLSAYRALVAGQFDRRAGVMTWLYRIVTNAAIDALRARRARHALAVQDVDMESQGSADAALLRVALRELAQWLDELPPEQRVAVILKEMEGMTSGEIARVLECSEGAIEQRLVRARATLRERIRREETK
jgi:RNA polymerase sigma-70 factor (ECF subfamily)